MVANWDRADLRFDEVWIDQKQLVLLASLASDTNPYNGAVIEIGTWQGMSALAIARAIQPFTLHVVDHWKGSSDIPAELSSRDNYAIFLENVRISGANNIQVHKQDWREFSQEWASPIRFLHLDAEHTADEVHDQITNFLPWIHKGIIAGDDYNFPAVREGIERQFHRHRINVRGNKLWWVTI